MVERDRLEERVIPDPADHRTWVRQFIAVGVYKK